MNFPFYIAKRYLFAKKSQTAVNILTFVAAIGVAVGTMALVIILSVFNGFEKLILSLFNSFNPDFEIRLIEGKTFDISDFPVDEIRQIPGVYYVGEVLEETALIMYQERQHIITLRGVDDNYRLITGIDTMIHEGIYELSTGDRNNLVLGQGVAYMINANINDFLNPLSLYLPRKGNVNLMNPLSAFSSSYNYASGVFSVQSEFDLKYVLAPISLVRFLTEGEETVTSVMVSAKPGSNLKNMQAQLASVAGEQFEVRNRMQQEEFMYKVMRSEKWAIFFILSFIIVIAAFNITGSLTMLILEKKNDINTLKSLGASIKTIRQIFLYEGLLISMGGALAGLLLGGLISWLQIQFGLVTIQAEGTFIIDAYPVDVKLMDFILVFITVSFIGIFASVLPVQKIKGFLN